MIDTIPILHASPCLRQATVHEPLLTSTLTCTLFWLAVQRRLLAVEVVAELVPRSRVIRGLLAANFTKVAREVDCQGEMTCLWVVSTWSRNPCSRCCCEMSVQVVERIAGVQPKAPLPPPAASATALQARALDLVQEWASAHGSRYPQVNAVWGMWHGPVEFSGLDGEFTCLGFELIGCASLWVESYTHSLEMVVAAMDSWLRCSYN